MEEMKTPSLQYSEHPVINLHLEKILNLPLYFHRVPYSLECLRQFLKFREKVITVKSFDSINLKTPHLKIIMGSQFGIYPKPVECLKPGEQVLVLGRSMLSGHYGGCTMYTWNGRRLEEELGLMSR